MCEFTGGVRSAAIVETLKMLTGVFFVPLLHMVDDVFKCEPARPPDSDAPALKSEAMCALHAGVNPDDLFWVPTWETCVPCSSAAGVFEWNIRSTILTATILVVFPFVIATLRLSTVGQDLSKLSVVPRRTGVVRAHLLTSWFAPSEIAPAACGPFTRDERGGAVFFLHQTAGKVVVVVLNAATTRHHPVILAILSVVWASWQFGSVIVYRPYASATLSRITLILRGIVLWSMLWTLPLSLAPSGASQILLTLCALCFAPIAVRALWGESKRVFDEDPNSPSILRTLQRANMLGRRRESFDWTNGALRVKRSTDDDELEGLEAPKPDKNGNARVGRSIDLTVSAADNVKVFSGLEVLWSAVF